MLAFRNFTTLDRGEKSFSKPWLLTGYKLPKACNRLTLDLRRGNLQGGWKRISRSDKKNDKGNIRVKTKKEIFQILVELSSAEIFSLKVIVTYTMVNMQVGKLSLNRIPKNFFSARSANILTIAINQQKEHTDSYKWYHGMRSSVTTVIKINTPSLGFSSCAPL